MNINFSQTYGSMEPIKRGTKRHRQWVKIIMLMGLLCIVFGAVTGLDSWCFKQNAISKPGKVIRNVRGNEGRTGHVFLYYDQNGRAQRFHGRVFSYPPRYSLGEYTTLLISEDGDEIHEDYWFDLYGTPSILMMFGSTFSAVALVSYRYAYNRKRQVHKSNKITLPAENNTC